MRDALGIYPDSYVEPYRYMHDVSTRNTVAGMKIIDARANLLSAEKLITGDKYIFIRNAYL